jgi:hypothetical protein
LSRLLVDLWAEATRSSEIRALLAGSNYHQPELVTILRMGALVQGLATTPERDDTTAHERIGIDRAA